MNSKDRMMGAKVEIVLTPEGWKFAESWQMANVVQRVYDNGMVRIHDLHVGPERITCFVLLTREQFTAESVDEVRDHLKRVARDAFYSTTRLDAAANA
jgi:hypothetical protein